MIVLMMDSEKNKPSLVSVSGHISDCCSLIGSDSISTEIRRIDGRKYEIMFDPAAAAPDGQNVSAVDQDGNRVLFGNILVFAPGENGLSFADADHIADRLGTISEPEEELGRWVLVVDGVNGGDQDEEVKI